MSCDHALTVWVTRRAWGSTEGFEPVRKGEDFLGHPSACRAKLDGWRRAAPEEPAGSRQKTMAGSGEEGGERRASEGRVGRRRVTHGEWVTMLVTEMVNREGGRPKCRDTPLNGC